MTIYDITQEWGGLTTARKRAALSALMDIYLDNEAVFGVEIDNILTDASMIEQDDGFGTEGADV